jgi:pyrroloquinoline-quinone synthase
MREAWTALGVGQRAIEQGLAITLDHFTTRALQERALEVLQFKLDVLWALSDGLVGRYGVTA